VVTPVRTRRERLTHLADRLLPIWFFAWSAFRLYQLGFIQLGWDFDWIGRDFRIYRNAALAIVNGTDPWSAFDRWNGTDWHFAALPTAAQLFVPFAWIPEEIGLAMFLGVTIGVALAALRRLGLPWWWLLFPPIMEGLAAANPQILILGLLLVGGPVARAIASGLKIYALVPVIARREWMAVLATALLIGASIALGPNLWSTYLGEFGQISARLGTESQGGVSAALLLDPTVFGSALPASGIVRVLPGLLLYGLVAGLILLVAIRDVRAAGWLFVPLLWPGAEYHYAAFALPVARRLSIWIIAIATLPTYLLGLVLLAYEVAANRPAIVREPPPMGLAAWLRAFFGRGGSGAAASPPAAAPD
jgi:hypothetical protein